MRDQQESGMKNWSRSTQARVEGLNNFIQESQLFEESGAVPLDDPAKDRRDNLQREVDTALQGIKEVAEALIASQLPSNILLARQLVVHRRAFKLLARAHYVTSKPDSQN